MARRRQLRDDPGMIVNDCMSRAPQRVRVTDRLDAAARVMWDHDCGFVPVLDGQDRLVGVLTDRDVSMAAYLQGRPLHELAVAAVMSQKVRTVRADDSLLTAMAAMQEFLVRRLPVVDAEGRLVGVLSSNDLVRHANAGHREVASEHVLRTLAVVGKSRRAATVLAAAATAANVEASAVRERVGEPTGEPTAPVVDLGHLAAGAAPVHREASGETAAAPRTVGRAAAKAQGGAKPAVRKAAARSVGGASKPASGKNPVGRTTAGRAAAQKTTAGRRSAKA